MATTEKVRVTNISNRHLGFKAPHKFTLRRKSDGPRAYMCSKVIGLAEVDASMRQWEAEGWLKIELFSEGQATPIEEAKAAAPKPASVDPEPKNKTLDLADRMTSPRDAEPEFSNLAEGDADDYETDTVVIAPHKGAMIKEAETAPGNPKDHSPEKNEGTVASGFDGSPNVDDEAPPTATAASDAAAAAEAKPEVPSFTEEALAEMGMKAVRGIIQNLELDVKSTSKTVLISAILEHQKGE